MVVKSEWIHPDRLRFIPDAKMKQFLKVKKEELPPTSAHWLQFEREKEDIAAMMETALFFDPLFPPFIQVE